MNYISPCDVSTSRATFTDDTSPALHLYVLHGLTLCLDTKPTTSLPHPLLSPTLLGTRSFAALCPFNYSFPLQSSVFHQSRPPPPSPSHRRQCPLTLVLLSNREMIVGGKCGKLQCPMTIEFQWLLCMSLLGVFHELAGATRSTENTAEGDKCPLRTSNKRGSI